MAATGAAAGVGTAGTGDTAGAAAGTGDAGTDPRAFRTDSGGVFAGAPLGLRAAPPAAAGV